VGELQTLAGEYVKSGATTPLTLKLNGAVKDGLVQHILGMDQQLGKHLAASRRSGDAARR
jgi:hypothetical protein